MNARNLHAARGARFEITHGIEVPADYGDTALEIQALRRGAGWVDRSARGRITLTGPEAAQFLQALFTNDVLQRDGRAVYGAFLTARGRMVADARVSDVDDGLLLDVEPQATAAVLAYLEKYHFTEQVDFEDRTAGIAQLGLFGSTLGDVLPALTGQVGRPPADLEQRTFAFEGETLRMAGNALIGEPGIDLFVPPALVSRLLERLEALGLRPVGWTALEMARIEAGVPRFGVELTDQTIPLEAGLGDRAISFRKGCYVGQEIIARIDARGEPARRLVGFSIEGGPVAPGTEVFSGERAVGVIHSSVVSLSLRGRPIGLGYVQKHVEDTAGDLRADGRQVWIVPLPFYPPRH